MLRIAPESAFHPPPGFRSFMDDFFAYSNRRKRLYAAHFVVTLCRFGRWLSWAFFPRVRFFPGWTDSIDGMMSLEMKAKITLKPNPYLLSMVGMVSPVLALTQKSFGIKKGA